MFEVLKRLLVRSATEQRGMRTPESEAEQLLQKAQSKSLSQDAKKWLVSIPESVWPKLICVRKPSVINDLADLWSQTVRFESYIDDLIEQDDPPDMPLSYREELERLKAYRQEFRRTAHAQRNERRSRERVH